MRPDLPGHPATRAGCYRACAMPTRRGQLLALASFLVIARLTLFPVLNVEWEPFRWCRSCGAVDAADVLRNVLLFVPFGMGLALSGLSVARALSIGAGTALAAELLQFSVIRGRDATVTDLLSNATGAVVGVLLAHGRGLLLRPTSAQARRVAWWASGAATAIVLGAGLGLRPRLLPAPIVVRHTSPEPPEWYQGRLLDVRVAGRAAPREAPLEAAWVRRALATPALTLSMRTTVPAATITRVYAVGIVGRDSAELLGISQFRDALVVHSARLAERLTLRVPELVVPGVFPERGESAERAPVDTMVVHVSVDGPRIRAVVERGEGTRTAELSLRPAQAWAFISPFTFNRPLVPRVLSALLVAMLVLPAAYHGALARPRQLAPCAIVIVAPLVAGWVFGVGAPTWSDWLSGIGAATIGVLLAGSGRHDQGGRRADGEAATRASSSPVRARAGVDAHGLFAQPGHAARAGAVRGA